MSDSLAVPITSTGDARVSEGTAADAATDDLMAPAVNVQRIMRTGTVWFAAALGAIALFMGPLLASGWRPADLPSSLETIWWLGSVGVVASLGLIGWSGCPILEVDVPTASRNKSRTMQLGTATLIVATALCVVAIMAGPAA